jgi:uncharacterized protein (TIGR03034 family)
MNARMNINGQKQGLHGDKTTTGAVCIGSLPAANQEGRGFLRQNDTTTPCPRCGKTGKIVEGVQCFRLHGEAAAVNDALISCGCPRGSNRLIAADDWTAPTKSTSTLTSTVSSNRAANQPNTSTPSKSSAPTSHVAPAPSSPPHREQPERIKLPTRIFLSEGKMDNYDAPDMQHGDLSEADLKARYPWAHSLQWRNLNYPLSRSRMWRWVEALRPDKLSQEQQRQADAKVLFDDFRRMSIPFSWVGPYRSLIDHMINHMQANTGNVFRHPLLDQALAEHESMEKSLSMIRAALASKIKWDHGFYPEALKGKLTEAVEGSGLPKFDSWMNRIDGMGITVHDTAATEITLKSLDIQGDHFRAEVHYRVQDHFGLDDVDIAHRLYGNLPLFQTWYVLQRWEGYNYRPFITEMSATRVIEGTRDK